MVSPAKKPPRISGIVARVSGLRRTEHRNFRELPFRNCLEIRDRSRIGAPRAAKRGGRSPNSGASCHQRGALRRFRLFSKQFRKGNSAKFGCSKQFSEASTRRCRVLVGNSSASLAPYLLDDGRGGLYLVEHRIRSSLQDLV